MIRSVLTLGSSYTKCLAVSSPPAICTTQKSVCSGGGGSNLLHTHIHSTFPTQHSKRRDTQVDPTLRECCLGVIRSVWTLGSSYTKCLAVSSPPAVCTTPRSVCSAGGGSNLLHTHTQHRSHTTQQETRYVARSNTQRVLLRCDTKCLDPRIELHQVPCRFQPTRRLHDTEIGMQWGWRVESSTHTHTHNTFPT